MPHSDPSPSPMEEEAAPIVGSIAGSSPQPEEDFAMVEAGEVQGIVENPTPTAEPASAQAQADEDMMVEIQQEKKTEVKLEDLFAGMDSDDDEFSSSKKPSAGQEAG
jgi:DNA primase small subunit